MVIPSRHDGRTAIVTGSTKSIGSAVAKRLAREVTTVVVKTRTSEDESQTVEAI
jgi:NAD(P)-dependent dehydrogenase (short-subunit alcohol dehydrogenase family)